MGPGTAFPDLRLEVVETPADQDRVAVWMGLIVRARFLAVVFGLRKALGFLPADLR